MFASRLRPLAFRSVASHGGLGGNVADFGALGTSYLPGDPNDPRRRPLAEGDALKILALTLPHALGPGAIAPDILLNSQGQAGQGASPLASLIAESIVRSVLGGTSPGSPFESLTQNIAPGGLVPPTGGAIPTSLGGQGSLAGVAQQEAAQPSGVASNVPPPQLPQVLPPGTPAERPVPGIPRISTRRGKAAASRWGK